MNDSENLNKQFEQLIEKSHRYDSIKSRNDIIINKLIAIKEEIDSITKELNPILEISTTRNTQNRSLVTEMIESCVQRMKLGLSVSSKWLEKEFPTATPNNITYVFSIKLKNMKNVQSRKEGVEKHLYFVKDY